MPPMTKAVKVTDETLDNLVDIKFNFLGEGITNCEVIDFLISEYNRQNELQQEQKRNIEKNYVPVSKYEKLFNEGVVTETGLSNQIDDYKNELQKIKDDEDNLKLKLEEQLDLNAQLQSAVSDKVNEISTVKSNNVELLQRMAEIEQTLKDIQNQHSLLRVEHNKTLRFIEDDCFEKVHLESLYHISRFLLKHQRRTFTSEQIAAALHPIPVHKIENALSLTRYKVLPVRRIENENGVAYCFDKRYLQ